MITIANHEIGREPFTIAECGLNHNGSLDRALEMIAVAKAAGCDAIKYQTFKAEGVCDAEQEYYYRQRDTDGLLRGVEEKRINIFRRCELPDSAWWILKKECDKQGIAFMSTPQNPSDLDLLLQVGIPAVKIGSDDLTNLPMLRYCSRDDVGLPVILSIGMSDTKDLLRALGSVNFFNCILLACTSQYPCPAEDVNVYRVATLRQSFPAIPIGFSDHTQGHQAATMAVALGACVFECHFTLDHNLAGPDHWWSKDPLGLAAWITAIREAHVMLGDGVVRPTAKELEAKGKYQRTKPA